MLKSAWLIAEGFAPPMTLSVAPVQSALIQLDLRRREAADCHFSAWPPSCFCSQSRLSRRAVCNNSSPASKYLAWEAGHPLVSSSTMSLRCCAIWLSPSHRACDRSNGAERDAIVFELGALEATAETNEAAGTRYSEGSRSRAPAEDCGAMLRPDHPFHLAQVVSHLTAGPIKG
jgi:hypothetical protein